MYLSTLLTLYLLHTDIAQNDVYKHTTICPSFTEQLGFNFINALSVTFRKGKVDPSIKRLVLHNIFIVQQFIDNYCKRNNRNILLPFSKTN